MAWRISGLRCEEIHSISWVAAAVVMQCSMVETRSQLRIFRGFWRSVIGSAVGSRNYHRSGEYFNELWPPFIPPPHRKQKTNKISKQNISHICGFSSNQFVGFFVFISFELVHRFNTNWVTYYISNYYFLTAVRSFRIVRMFECTKKKSFFAFLNLKY